MSELKQRAGKSAPNAAPSPAAADASKTPPKPSIQNAVSWSKWRSDVFKSVSQGGPILVDCEEKGPYTDWDLRFYFLMAFVVPWILVAYFDQLSAEEMGARVQADLYLKEASAGDRGFLDDQAFWTLVAVLSLPHVTYLIVWTNADVFYDLAENVGEPFQVFAMLAHLIKAVQGLAVLLYFVGWDALCAQDAQNNLLTWGIAFLAERNVTQLLAFTQLFTFGQLLNYAVYKKIGEAGVYYGCRLGHEVDWVYSFPFSTVPHPQYLGATLSIWGAVFLCSAAYAQGIYAIGAVMTVYYFTSSMHEQHL